jgi:inhibitor of cysteine peptidase
MVIAITITASLLLTGLYFLWQPSSQELPDGNLPAFQSDQQLRTFLDDRGLDQGRSMYDSMEAASGAEPSIKNYHSKTNVQVAGVDEYDTVKTDGTYLYIVSADRVSIVRAYPASEMANVSNILAQDLLDDDDLTIYLIGIYVLEDQLIIVGQVYESYGPLVYDAIDIWPGIMRSQTMVFQVDVSDRTVPVISHRYAISGYHLTSRLIGDRLFVVTDQYIWYSNDQEMPMVWHDDVGAQLSPQDIRFDPNASYVGSFTNILGIDLGAGSYNATSVLTSYTSVIYVSQSDIYLTYVDWSSAMVWVSEGDGKDNAVARAESTMPQTTIYRLELQGISAVPVAKGEVDGFLLNQFSLDAKDGVLRLATTSGWQDQENMVFTLDHDLQVMGRLDGLGLNESIQSARFLDDTLYLVTFERVDPLFVIDLSDPYHPTALGELVLPGFSSYLHPLGNGLLLGVGTENSTLKLSIFNVSDPLHPVEVQSFRAEGWAYSDAQWDHKAVLFDERNGLFVVPVHSYDPSNWTVQQSTYVFEVSTDGIGLKGVLSNGETESASRSVVIEDSLYTISCNVLAAWSLSDLEAQGKLFYDDLFLDWYQYGGVPVEGESSEGASGGKAL